MLLVWRRDGIYGKRDLTTDGNSERSIEELGIESTEKVLGSAIAAENIGSFPPGQSNVNIYGFFYS